MQRLSQNRQPGRPVKNQLLDVDVEGVTDIDSIGVVNEPRTVHFLDVDVQSSCELRAIHLDHRAQLAHRALDAGAEHCTT